MITKKHVMKYLFEDRHSTFDMMVILFAGTVWGKSDQSIVKLILIFVLLTPLIFVSNIMTRKEKELHENQEETK